MSISADLAAIVGEKYVTQLSDSQQFETDWVGKYKNEPLAIVRPATAKEIADILKFANKTGTPVVPVAGNTGLNGGAHAVGAILLSVDRMNKIRSTNAKGRTMTVEAGVILSNIHDAAAAEDLVFPLTFGAKGSCMVGGFLSTNAGGSNVVKYGNTRDLVMGIEVVTPQGEIMDLMSELHKDNSGLNLKHLLIGAEGTLGIITAAVLKLQPMPKAYATAMVATPTVDEALTLLHRLQSETGGAVEAFELMPRKFIDMHKAHFQTDKGPFDEDYDVNILVEIGSTVDAMARIQEDGSIPLTQLLETTLGKLFEDGLLLDAVVAQNQSQRTQMWERRESAAEVCYLRKPSLDTDVAVPLDKVESFLNNITGRMTALDAGATDVAIAHLGDGNIHYNVYPTRDDPTLIDAMRETIEDVTKEYRGSFSAEHGIGISKLPSMRRRKDPTAVAAMQAIKLALDPNNILNPGKTIP